MPDLSTPTLPNLSYALRHPETWPAGFAWDYGGCQTCAMGLTAQLWGDTRERRLPCTTVMARILGISLDDATHIGLGVFHGDRSTTAEEVADEIDRLVASRA